MPPASVEDRNPFLRDRFDVEWSRGKAVAKHSESICIGINLKPVVIKGTVRSFVYVWSVSVLNYIEHVKSI